MNVRNSRVNRPSDVTSEELKRLERMLSSESRPSLHSPQGDIVELPQDLNDMLLKIVRMMERNQVVFLMPENESFTTQAAANYLGFSRQFLVGLLNKGEIPFYYAGTHRRIELKDLIHYSKTRHEDRVRVLTEMSNLVKEHHLDDEYVDLSRKDDAETEV